MCLNLCSEFLVDLLIVSKSFVHRFSSTGCPNQLSDIKKRQTFYQNDFTKMQCVPIENSTSRKSETRRVIFGHPVLKSYQFHSETMYKFIEIYNSTVCIIKVLRLKDDFPLIHDSCFRLNILIENQVGANELNVTKTQDGQGKLKQFKFNKIL